MPLLGQASGGWTESSSALRILNVGIRNSIGVLTDDAFTQTNPPVVTTNVTAKVDKAKTGVLSGSVCFARNDIGSNYIGGPVKSSEVAGGADNARLLVLGVFVNSANGNSFENTPGTASGKGTYVSGMGTYGNALYEDKNLNSGAALTYAVGDRVYASRNGYLTNITGDANNDHDTAHGAPVTVVGVVKMPPDSTMNELVYDQRI